MSVPNILRSTVTLFVMRAVTEGLIAPSYVATTSQLDDIFTKALGKSQFDNLLSNLDIFDPHHAPY